MAFNLIDDLKTGKLRMIQDANGQFAPVVRDLPPLPMSPVKKLAAMLRNLIK